MLVGVLLRTGKNVREPLQRLVKIQFQSNTGLESHEQPVGKTI
mgnify:CR=1 FL=1